MLVLAFGIKIKGKFSNESFLITLSMHNLYRFLLYFQTNWYYICSSERMNVELIWRSCMLLEVQFGAIIRSESLNFINNLIQSQSFSNDMHNPIF